MGLKEYRTMGVPTALERNSWLCEQQSKAGTPEPRCDGISRGRLGAVREGME